MPSEIFTIPGIIVILIVSSLVLSIVIILAKSVGKFMQNLKLKTNNFEIAASGYKDSLQKTEELTSVLTRELLKRQLAFAQNRILSLEDEVTKCIYSKNQETIDMTQSYNLLVLFVRYMLSNLVAEVSKYISSNHIGEKPEEIELYIKTRSKQLLYFLRVFVNLNEGLLPAGVEYEKGFNDLNENGLAGFIEDNFRDLLMTCKDLGATISTKKSIPIPPTIPILPEQKV